MNPVEAKRRVCSHINAHLDDLWQIVRVLFENPEIAFQEFQASALIKDYLAKAGFKVEAPIGGLDTAFQAVITGNNKGPIVAFLAEYDALPQIGHACGHDLIAAGAIGAGIGVKSILNEFSGEIRVIGTPAEEGGGGKRILVDAGVFNEVQAAMMFHPASKNMVNRGSLASLRLKIEFIGQTAHAAASPQEGINALDAMILTFNNINALRQHLEIKDRIAGIITHGGDAANIIPGFTSAEFSVRGENETRRGDVLQKVIACAEAAAMATGCELTYKSLPGYTEIVPNPTLADLFANNLSSLGRVVITPDPYERMGSTDMGNVSKVVPSIHPYLKTVPEEIAGHTTEFRDICMTEPGKQAMLDAAKAMAMTAIDLLSDPSLVKSARAELDDYLD